MMLSINKNFNFMNALLWAVSATFLVSLLSFMGLFTIGFKKESLDKVLLLFVGFSAGALMGDAFLHLIPDGLKKISSDKFFIYLLVGIIIFFIMERVIQWHHCHKPSGTCEVQVLTYTNLAGDTLHNFIDGLIIAASFVVDWKLGIATTLAVILHEIPQEIGHFCTLLYGGFSKKKALLFNFFSAIFAIFGSIVGVLISRGDNTIGFLLALTAGGFIYISSSDLIPELHKEKDLKKSLASLFLFLAGIALMLFVKG